MSNTSSKHADRTQVNSQNLRAYSSPKLTLHGKIADLTLGGSVVTANCESDGFLGDGGTNKTVPCP